MRRADELLSGNLWLRRLRSGDGTARLVCFPHGGGSAGSFRPVARALPEAFEVLAVQYPGRQNRLHEDPIESIQLMADGIVAALDGYEPDVLFGHSMGALIAFEVARRLSVRRLVVSAMAAPPRVFQLDMRGLREAGVTHRLAFMTQEMRWLGGDLPDDQGALMGALPAFLGDYIAMTTYCPDPGSVVDCGITALVSDDDPLISGDDPRNAFADLEAWHEHTRGDFELQVLHGGGHFYLEEHADEVSACLVRVLSLEKETECTDM